MKKVLFIINPHSGVDRVKALQRAIDANLDTTLFQPEIVYTEYEKHGTLLAKQGVETGFDLIVAVGGDGSVNDVVNGLYGTPTVMGIIPKGSGNGLARSLKIPMNEDKAIRLLNQWKVQDIDVGEAAGHLFVSNAGVGFDTLVTEEFKKSKNRGLKSYLAIIMKNIWRYKIRDWQLKIDGNESVHRCFMLTVANGVQLGYGFKIAPDARLDDGLFDLVFIRKFPKVLSGEIALRAFSGKIEKSRFVTTQRAAEIEIRHPQLNLLQIDGEALACGSEVVIRMMPDSLKVISNL